MEVKPLPIDKAALLPNNPRAGHRLKALAASMARHGFGSAVTCNTTTGHVIAGNGRIRALRRMKRAGDPPPAGVTVEGKRWTVPAVWGTWPADQEQAVAIALNGGVNGSLEGDADRDVIAAFLARADEAAREALGLTDHQAEQFQLDHAAPIMPPQINLEGIQRTAAAEADAETPTAAIKVLLPRPLADRFRAALRHGATAADIIDRGLPHDEPAAD